MKVADFTSLHKIEGPNMPGEFAICAIDDKGMLIQGVGISPAVAVTLIEMIEHRVATGDWKIPDMGLRGLLDETPGQWVSRAKLLELLGEK